MIFKKKEEKTETYSVEQCKSCGKNTKRKFIPGDFVFKTMSPCTSCNSTVMISKIFSEIIK